MFLCFVRLSTLWLRVGANTSRRNVIFIHRNGAIYISTGINRIKGDKNCALLRKKLTAASMSGYAILLAESLVSLQFRDVSQDSLNIEEDIEALEFLIERFGVS